MRTTKDENALFQLSQETSIIGELPRINLISGKGGVGRTTLSFACARAKAAQGKKTLWMEIQDDSGWESSLQQFFPEIPINHLPIEIEPHLYAVRLDARFGQESFLNSFLKIPALSQMILGNTGVRWFLEGAPAFREMGVFYHFLNQLKSDYDFLFMDLPATGHMVGLAKLPHQLLQLLPVGPIADRLKEGQSYLYDPKQTATWIVTLPENLPVSESLELFRSLEQERLPVRGFILNRTPFNPFTEQEEIEVQRIAEKNKTSRLLVELERLKRVRAHIARIKEETHSSVWLSPERPKTMKDPTFGFRVKRA